MKSFRDLKFYPHERFPSALHAHVDFKNGYGISVISGPGTLTDDEHPYEVCVCRGGRPICPSDPHTYLTASGVTRVMRTAQRRKPCKHPQVLMSPSEYLVAMGYKPGKRSDTHTRRGRLS